MSISQALKSKINLLILLWSVLAIWVLGTPFGGVADEPQYLRNGIYYTLSSLTKGEPTIPAATANNIDQSACFAFRPEISAQCKIESNQIGMISAEPPKLLYSYPQPWFWLTSWPAILIDGEFGPLFARIFAGILSMTAISIGILFWKRDTRLLWLATILALNPLSMSVIAGYNPNSMEIAGSLSLALMLFGKKSTLKFNRDNLLLILCLLIVTLLTSSAKPMSGTFVLFAIFLYFINEKWGGTKGSDADKLKTKESNVLTELPALIFLCMAASINSLILSLGSFGAASDATQNFPLYRQYWASTVRFLGLSDKYALEYAGIFGWRDTGPAPWMQILWIAFFISCMKIIFSKQEINIKKYLFCLWATIFIVLPLIQTLLLAHTASVGLQTRYLAGYFCTIAVYSALLAKNINTKFLTIHIRIFILILLFNQIWVLTRFSVGLRKGYIPNLENLLSGNFWLPYFGVIYLILVFFLFYKALNPKSRFLDDHSLFANTSR
jgi:hypothetical protein